MVDVRRESSASELLRGLEYRGKPIESVWVEGGGNRRLIVFNDGSTASSTKEKIAALSRIRGTLNQLKKYQHLGSGERRKMLEKSRQRQYALKQSTAMNLVDELARARSPKRKKQLRDKIRQVLTHPVESPLVTGKSVLDAVGSDVHKDVSAAKNVRWVTIRRGGRYVRIPIEEKRWALRFQVRKKPKKV